MSVFRIVVVRHGQRDKREGVEDHESNLTEHGEQEARNLAAQLKHSGVVLNHCFTSSYPHATQTTGILVNEAGDPRSQIEEAETVEVLTPGHYNQEELFEKIDRHASEKETELDGGYTVALVGHQPQLNILITQMTSKRFRPLDHLEAMCLEGSFEDFRCGRAEVTWRIPVKAYQEAELRAKITSKLTVATLLAGFSFAALVQLTTAASPALPTLDDLLAAQSTMALIAALLKWLAVISLATAGALFTATAYIYDRLSMPEGFWTASRSTDSEKPPIFVRDKEAFIRRKNEYGPVYVHMVHAWTHVFTPGVALAALGFLLLVIHAASVLVVFCALALIATVWYYRGVRPELGVD